MLKVIVFHKHAFRIRVADEQQVLRDMDRIFQGVVVGQRDAVLNSCGDVADVAHPGWHVGLSQIVSSPADDGAVVFQR